MPDRSAPDRPGDPAAPDPSGPEVLGSDAPRLGDRWTALPARLRRLALAAAGLALLAAAGGYALVAQPEPEPPAPGTPVKYPIHSTDIAFVSIDAPEEGTSAFYAHLSAISDTGAWLERITQPYEGLHVAAVPPLPLELKQGRPTRVTVRFEVSQCALVPLHSGLPFLDVTLRNTRAIQDYSAILGETYAVELSTALRTICEPSLTPAHPDV